jgi:hypothetical protein
MSALLQSVVQDLINDRSEQALATIHQYFVEKVQESMITEAEAPSVHDAVMKAIEVAMGVRHSQLADLDVGANYVSFAGVYEFPEHRTGLVAEARKHVKSIGTIKGSNSTHYNEFVTSFEIEFKDSVPDLTHEEGEKLEAAIKARFKAQLQQR